MKPEAEGAATALTFGRPTPNPNCRGDRHHTTRQRPFCYHGLVIRVVMMRLEIHATAEVGRKHDFQPAKAVEREKVSVTAANHLGFPA